ncbi:MAG: tellurium resistance protein TerC [Planctomycetes bacterium]|nr:tellurium resistance protein TerC [Planctomycetota bacterium]
MGELFTIANLMTLAMLTLLQAVLGFDNLLYISIESKRVPEEKQRFVRQLGIGLAIGLRIVLLLVVMSAIEHLKEPFFALHLKGVFEGEFNVHSLITLVGGGFILYTAMKEIYHLLAVDDIDGPDGDRQRSVAVAITWIVVMNLVFSFDSILSALALTKVFAVMATAIVISGLLMIWLSDHVSEFLKKNRMYEVLGLFILFIVGVMLLSEGAHLAHIHLFGSEVEAMTKSTFYFVLAVLVVIDIVQSRYQKKLLEQRHAETH